MSREPLFPTAMISKPWLEQRHKYSASTCRHFHSAVSLAVYGRLCGGVCRLLMCDGVCSVLLAVYRRLCGGVCRLLMCVQAADMWMCDGVCSISFLYFVCLIATG